MIKDINFFILNFVGDGECACSCSQLKGYKIFYIVNIVLIIVI
jgi:hypothetical protein